MVFGLGCVAAGAGVPADSRNPGGSTFIDDEEPVHEAALFLDRWLNTVTGSRSDRRFG
jgi:hypothetical protein